MTSTRGREWWRNGVVYQVYPRSFADANGDGLGDVEGIRSRLPHLVALGVDAIWISPWYPSPLLDGGYDVADYRDIDRRFGSLDDARRLIAEAHALGIRIIVDIVPNHTSWEHPWFVEARAAAPGSPARRRYVIRPGRGDTGDQPPTNWTAVFGGPAWTRLDDGEWYLHLFDSSQPDLDWTNPEVRAEFRDIFRFWIEVGVDGFRIDVAHGLAKDQRFPDLDVTARVLENAHIEDHPHWDRDEVHEIIREWRAVLDAEQRRVGRDLMMVAEAWVHPASLPKYLRVDEYHQSFNFDFLQCDWDATLMAEAIDRALLAADTVGSTPTWALSNHDVVRHPTRYGLPAETDWRTWLLDGPHGVLDRDLGLRRARAATMMLLALPGSTYLYQGEELGLHEVHDLPAEVLDDPVWENSGRTVKGRDGCRVPLPWAATGPSLGFGSGDATPWLPQPSWFAGVSAAAQDGIPGSTLELYRAAMRLRRANWLAAGPLEWSDKFNDPESQVLAFRRRDLLCIVNFGDEPVPMPAGEVLLVSSESDDDSLLPGAAAAWVGAA
ncbi:MAG: hypothetical protein RIR49_562 [Actinomycetota bacterium]